MAIKLDIDVKMEIIFNEETGECEIISSTPKIVKQEKINRIISEEYDVKFSDLKYGILSLGAKSQIGQNLPINTKVKITFEDLEGNRYPINAKTHKKYKGRIDRLTEIYRELGLKCGYDLEEKEIEKIKFKVSYHIQKQELYIKLLDK